LDVIILKKNCKKVGEREEEEEEQKIDEYFINHDINKEQSSNEQNP